jgi:hypothetical protein
MGSANYKINDTGEKLIIFGKHKWVRAYVFYDGHNFNRAHKMAEIICTALNAEEMAENNRQQLKEAIATVRNHANLLLSTDRESFLLSLTAMEATASI